MLYREIIAVCSQIHTKHINTLCGRNVELLNVKFGSIYSNQWTISVSAFTRLVAAVGTSRRQFRTPSISLLYSRIMNK